MVHLVLDAHSQRALIVPLERLTAAILGAHANLRRPLHLIEHAGHRQAAFFRHGDPFARQDLGVDENQRLIALLGDVDHQQAQRGIHLGRGEADAGRCVHRLEHVIDEAPQLGVETRNRKGPSAQPGVGKFQDRSEAHGSGFSKIRRNRPETAVKVRHPGAKSADSA